MLNTLNVPKLELVCFTIRYDLFAMYLQPQTVHQHCLTEITELAATFGGILTWRHD